MTHHSIASHLFGGALLGQMITVAAVLAGIDPFITIVAVTVAAGALGWLVELSQHAFGWGTYSRLDVAVTAAGGPLGFGMTMLAASL